MFQFTRYLLVATFTAGIIAAMPHPVSADSSCVAPIANLVNIVSQPGYYLHYEITFHRNNVQYVSYASGDIGKYNSATWPLNGTYGRQLFSDRYTGGQPFNVGAADQITVWISNTGLLYIYFNTWSGASQWDMTCFDGNTLTKAIPGYGVITMTLYPFFFG